ncbi:hypothetical protein DFH29DRAFT_1004825 [Suillus ampliporus]|nr:hypothetical protein DFH29DRAFT_1004825 [Suillus ampliporus]
MSLHPDISPSLFITIRIDLESEQHCSRSDIALQGAHPTDRQKTAVVYQQNTLQCKVDAWKQVQLLYTPAAQFVSSRMETISIPDNPEDIKPFLPSLLTADSISCSPYLLTIKWELQITQAGDALDKIRQSL